MSLAQDYETRVTGALDEKVVGFAWVTLIPLLLPILTEFLSGCLNKQPKAAVNDRISKGKDDFWVRVNTRRALNMTLKDSDTKMTLAQKSVAIDTILDELAKTDSTKLLDEIKDNSSDWVLI